MKRFHSKLMLALSALALVVVFACTGESKAKEKPHYTVKETPNTAPLANIDGKSVTEEELMGEGEERMEYGEALRKVYDARMGRVGHVLLERVYGEAAKKAGTSLDEYVETKVLKGDDKISDADFNKFVKEKQIPKEQIAQLKDRIYAYMKMQKKQEQMQSLIVKLSKEHKVELYFGKPSVKMNIEIGTSPTFGKKDSKVKIVEFSDFQCPFCSRAAKTVQELKKKYGNKIEFAFKQYPLPMHPNAKPASEAALCVNEQGSEKFWKYHDKLFA
ncbi:MAG: thioredoxin domain-containing protein, partial [Deltaproteobacteria bacterium]|nr:thioredoxin domain-containing protein [Deltaproteobacteria bacterium]